MGDVREKSWSVWGPNSGGGYEVWFREGQLWHHYYGDSAPNGLGDEWVPETPASFAREQRSHGRYRAICAWLRAEGLLASDD
jgi:hypothetical protein